jgi:hypothetical protein
MKITENQLRKEVRKVISEQTAPPKDARDWRREQRNADRRMQYQWQKKTGQLPDRGPRVSRGKFTGKLRAWADGAAIEFNELPSNIQRIVRLFDSLDPERKLMNTLEARKGSGGGWRVNMWGEQWGYRRTRGKPSGYASVGGDYTLVDLPAEVDDEVKISWGIFADVGRDGVIEIKAHAGPERRGYGDESREISRGKRVNSRAVKEWGQANLKTRGYGWQLEPFAEKPSGGYTSAGSMGGWDS